MHIRIDAKRQALDALDLHRAAVLHAAGNGDDPETAGTGIGAIVEVPDSSRHNQVTVWFCRARHLPVNRFVAAIHAFVGRQAIPKAEFESGQDVAQGHCGFATRQEGTGTLHAFHARVRASMLVRSFNTSGISHMDSSDRNRRAEWLIAIAASAGGLEALSQVRSISGQPAGRPAGVRVSNELRRRRVSLARARENASRY